MIRRNRRNIWEGYCETPGMRIRSGGMGRGLARGRGMGPMGFPKGNWAYPRSWGRGRFRNIGW